MISGLPDLCCSRSILVARVLSTRFSSKRCPMPGRRTGNCESLWNILPVGSSMTPSRMSPTLESQGIQQTTFSPVNNEMK